MSNQEAPVIPSSNSLQHHQRPPRYSPPFGNSILERSDPQSSSTHSVSPTTNGSVNSVNGHYNGQSSVVQGNGAGLMSNGTAQRLSEEAAKKHLPLRKRIGSLPKKKAWIPPPVPPPSSQPQATTERRVSYPPTPTSSHDIKTADYYSASPYSDGGDTTETDEEKAADFKEKKPPDRKQTVIIHAEAKERRISMPLLSQPAVIPKSTTPGSTTAPSATSTATATVTKMKPLKKVQHWIIKGKMNGAAAVPPKNGLVTPSEERFSDRQPLSRKPSWAEDDRPAPKKTKRGRPPSNQPRPPFLSDAVSEKPRSGESIVATAMAAAKGRRNSIRQQGNTSSNGAGYSDEVLYCICRKPYDRPRFMIACDRCDQWFHGECIGISEKEGEFIDLYFCDDCAKATGKSTSWKPKCSNPACPKAARIGSHQGHVSKYCSNTCGMQVARARLELSEIKRKAGGCATSMDIKEIVARREKKARLESLSDKDDQRRLVRLKEAKQRMKAEIVAADRKLAFLKALVQTQNKDVCGFDSRLIWPDSVWHSVCDDFAKAENGQTLITRFSSAKAHHDFTVCSESKCARHGGWQHLKHQEFEQDRSALFSSLATFMRQRKQIKARIRRRRESAREDTDEWLAHTTISHSSN